MKKVSVQKVEQSVVTYYCDICNEKIIGFLQCSICGRHMCQNHTTFDDKEMGDYPTRYCTECWDIGETFRNRIQVLEDETYMIIDKLEEEWKILALKNVEEIK